MAKRRRVFFIPPKPEAKPHAAPSPVASRLARSAVRRRVFADVTAPLLVSAAYRPQGSAWHLEDAEIRAYDPKLRRSAPYQRWTCDYGCKSMYCRGEPAPGTFHAWDCPYWHHEGRGETPF